MVRVSVAEEPKMCISRRPQKVGFCESITWRILQTDLVLKTYKVEII